MTLREVLNCSNPHLTNPGTWTNSTATGSDAQSLVCAAVRCFVVEVWGLLEAYSLNHQEVESENPSSFSGLISPLVKSINSHNGLLVHNRPPKIQSQCQLQRIRTNIESGEDKRTLIFGGDCCCWCRRVRRTPTVALSLVVYGSLKEEDRCCRHRSIRKQSCPN